MKLGYLWHKMQSPPPPRGDAAPPPQQRASEGGVQLSTWRRGRSKFKAAPPTHRTGDTAVAGLTSLPVEIQFMVISQLGLADMVALRQTSHLYRSVITADVVQRHFTNNGQYDAILLGCCTGCLSMPGLDHLILDATRENHLWRSICFRCWRNSLDKGYQRKHGSVLELASGKEGYICHFCAWPVSRGAPDSAVELLHAPCRIKRLLATVIWFLMAIIQVGLGVLALVLAWTIYKRTPTVIYPTSIDFGLSVVALIMFMVRTCTADEQTYAYALAAELGMTIVRIPPVCFTARETLRTQGTQWSPMARFALGIFLMNLILRFVDTVGYALLYFGYDPRSMFLAGLPLRKKILYYICTVIVWCAFIPN